jgi:dihydrofolate reductase
MNSLPKFVFSKTLKNAEWSNTKLVKDGFVDEVSKLKQQSEKDIAIFGSSDLAVTLIDQGLINEYRIMINPIVLGDGKSLFSGIQNKLDLKLMKTRTFGNGNVLLYYVPAQE